jgi:MFS superfamily sulfate permease-like transporter
VVAEEEVEEVEEMEAEEVVSARGDVMGSFYPAFAFVPLTAFASNGVLCDPSAWLCVFQIVVFLYGLCGGPPVSEASPGASTAFSVQHPCR